MVVPELETTLAAARPQHWHDPPPPALTVIAAYALVPHLSSQYIRVSTTAVFKFKVSDDSAGNLNASATDSASLSATRTRINH